MYTWVLVAISVICWSLMIIRIVGSIRQYRRDLRVGLRTGKELSVHITADLIGVAIALGAFYVIHRIAIQSLGSLGLRISDLQVLIIYALVSLPLAWGTGRLYRRFLDARVRDFLAREQETATQAAH